VVFVVGFARSGTSALTRSLSLAGMSLPPRLLGALKAYPAGFWEPRDVVYLNEAILRRHGSAGFDPTMSLDINEVQEEAYIEKMRAWLVTLPPAPVTVIKDPKCTVLSGMWFAAARQAGFEPMAVVAVRHPYEAVDSIRAARGVSPELAGALWMKYSFLAERRTRDIPRVFVDYGQLMDNWQREVKRVGAGLGITLDTDTDTVETFLTPALRNHRHHGPITEPFATVYRELSAAARDEPFDQALLDRVYVAYSASERGWRVIHDDYRRWIDRYRRIPLKAIQLFIEINAVIRRRRDKTWA
jgi:hypothetical protein